MHREEKAFCVVGCVLWVIPLSERQHRSVNLFSRNIGDPVVCGSVGMLAPRIHMTKYDNEGKPQRQQKTHRSIK